MESKQKFTRSCYKEDELFTRDDVELIGDCLRLYADTQGHKDAIVFASSDGVGDRQVVTFKELYVQSVITGKALSALGVQPGEIVALNLRPCPEWLFLAFGTILAGATVVNISFTYTDGSDLIAMMKMLQTCALLALDPGVDGSNWEILRKHVDNFNQEDGKASSKEMPYLRYLIGHEFPNSVKIKPVADLHLFEDHHGIELPKRAEDDIAVLFQTSGSTGVPKLVAHTHASLLYTHRLRDCVLVNKDHIYFNDRPFNWMGGFPNSVFAGQTRVTVSGFGPRAEDHVQRALDVISEEGCSLAIMLPPMLDAMIHAQVTFT